MHCLDQRKWSDMGTGKLGVLAAAKQITKHIYLWNSIKIHVQSNPKKYV